MFSFHCVGIVNYFCTCYIENIAERIDYHYNSGAIPQKGGSSMKRGDLLDALALLYKIATGIQIVVDAGMKIMDL